MILFKLGFVKYTMIHIAASVMYKPEIVFTPLGFITGLVGDTVTSGIIGIITVFMLTIMGYDYWWYKGILLLTAIWFFGFGVLINLGITHINPTDDPNFRIAALFVHQFFGLLTAYLIYRYSSKELKNS